MADRSIFTVMEEKDPALFRAIARLPLSDAVDRWVDKYPDDLPKRGHTELADVAAIKPRNDAK